MNKTENMASEMKKHLEYKIVPFWKNLIDRDYGGFYGNMDFDLNVSKNSVKGCILNSRILWFFSKAYLTLKDESLLDYANHAYLFLKEKCMDYENGGVYWSLNYDGTVYDSTKHTYCQAFAVYVLTSYYEATKNNEALLTALNLYNIIEEKCTDEYGYMEAFDKNFKPIQNDKLSENEVIAEKTMNTILHVFEAYTELYRMTKNKEIEQKIKDILNLFSDKIYNPKYKRLEVFFDKKWESIIDLHSYGHDIEAAWLIDRGCEVLNDKTYTDKMQKITKAITENIYNTAYISKSLINESENKVNDTKRIWWVQAEAVVGFFNGYEKNPNCIHYLKASFEIWDYIKKYFIDTREGSEWFWALDEFKKPLEKPIVEQWKCPYHNGRMCMEIIGRIKNDA